MLVSKLGRPCPSASSVLGYSSVQCPFRRTQTHIPFPSVIIINHGHHLAEMLVGYHRIHRDSQTKPGWIKISSAKKAIHPYQLWAIIVGKHVPYLLMATRHKSSNQADRSLRLSTASHVGWEWAE